MVDAAGKDLLPALETWLQGEPAVHSAALFGSRARASNTAAPADGWSDVDLHIVTGSPRRILETDWSRAMPGHEFCLQVLRPATGGVNKLTVLFSSGEADLVLVPVWQMRLASLTMKLGLHRRVKPLKAALNAFAMPISYGYRFLKGERKWGSLYARVVAEMEGYRLSNDDVCRLAETFLYDQLYLLQKLGRGELITAQRVLHRSLVETNLVLLHELRVRRGELSIQQARRVEQLASPTQLATVQLSARLERAEIIAAAWRARAGLETLMKELVPAWTVPAAMADLLAPHALR